MANEYIRLDTTIIGIDSLINKASTAEEAKVLFTAKDVIYSQQKYAADVQPMKQWVKLHDKHPDTEGFYLVCDQYGECEVAEYLPDIKSWFTHKIKGEIRYWMPLPELPKDGETSRKM